MIIVQIPNNGSIKSKLNGEKAGEVQTPAFFFALKTATLSYLFYKNLLTFLLQCSSMKTVKQNTYTEVAEMLRPTDLEISIARSNARESRRIYIRTDRNGTKYYSQPKACTRCGGAGQASQWQFTGLICYKCGGTGETGTEIVKEYTPEYQAKLDAKREKKLEEQRKIWEAQEAEREKERKEREAEEARRKEEEERKVREQKAISQYFGEVGKRYELDLTFDHSAWFEVPSFGGFGTEIMHIYTFKDENGNVFVWKTTSVKSFEKGLKVHLKGTVKEHSTYNEEKQTVLTRCNIK